MIWIEISLYNICSFVLFFYTIFIVYVHFKEVLQRREPSVAFAF